MFSPVIVEDVIVPVWPVVLPVSSTFTVSDAAADPHSNVPAIPLVLPLVSRGFTANIDRIRAPARVQVGDRRGVGALHIERVVVGTQIDVQDRQAQVGDALQAPMFSPVSVVEVGRPVWPVVLPVSSTFVVSLPLPTMIGGP